MYLFMIVVSHRLAQWLKVSVDDCTGLSSANVVTSMLTNEEFGRWAMYSRNSIRPNAFPSGRPAKTRSWDDVAKPYVNLKTGIEKMN